ncbi:SBBP repeat-containing protein, partial [Candidatus Amoebophilus asiaticus]|nr:SBBP repeat-containing protein [Candidatus Amoebophilus asiaticus]
GNVCITGRLVGTADFDPGVGTANLTTEGLEDIFFAKYDSDGNYVWAKGIGSTNNDSGYGIAVDISGNIYITGVFQATADFDPGAGTTNLTAIGLEDIFFAKYDPNGNYTWSKGIGGTSSGVGIGIAVNSSGNVYITGGFLATADFDPGTDTANLTSAGLCDIFFAKYDTGGNYVWAKGIGSTSYDLGHGIALGGSGNVYITGRFQGTADFDPGIGTANLISAGDYDIFFARYSVNANTGINEYKLSSKVLIYPNPFNTSTTLTTNNLNKTPYMLEILNILGEKVRGYIFTSNTLTIKKGNLRNGIYFYILTENTQSIQTGKLIIN